MNAVPPSPIDLRALRRRALLTQAEAAHAAGIRSRQHLSKLERGQHAPRLGTLRRLLTLYDMSIRTNEQRERTWGTGEEQTGAPPVGQGVGAQRAGGTLSHAAQSHKRELHRSLS